MLRDCRWTVASLFHQRLGVISSLSATLPFCPWSKDTNCYRLPVLMGHCLTCANVFFFFFFFYTLFPILQAFQHTPNRSQISILLSFIIVFVVLLLWKKRAYTESHLNLDLNKTKKIMVDFKRLRHTHGAIQILSETVEIVHSYKTSERSLRTPCYGILTPRPSLRKGTRDSFCCRSSDLLTLIQLFLSRFITLLLRTLWPFISFAVL